MRPTMTLLCGIPGAGKTTWARQHPTLGVLLHDIKPCPNWWTRERERRRHAAAHLAAGRSVIVDGCNLNASVRSDWRRVAHQRHAPCHLVIFDTPTATALHRNRGRTDLTNLAMAGYIERWPAASAQARNERWHNVTIVRTEPEHVDIEEHVQSVSNRQSRPW